MGEVLFLAKLAGWGKAALAWLKTLPWYMIALAVCLAVIAWDQHAKGKLSAELKQAYTDLAGWKRAHDADVAANLKLMAALSRQNAAVDALKAQADALAQEAAQARQEAALAAVKRDKALQLLKAAQAEPIKDDCGAPDAHNQVRGLL